MPLAALQNYRREQAYLRLPKQCPCSMRLTARPLLFRCIYHALIMGSQKKILTDMTDLLFVENLGFTRPLPSICSALQFGRAGDTRAMHAFQACF
ncbi:hypothetical protein CDEST_12279 [Colletotrichum destructivum]|uniref:Uncharacterized protein n=1 Tax=Colletotrichum destructivum TaxID=34406 RepID=A0AAX4IVI7_9PEZI|nr:hypothetical protein CDEST_12279 [Colletotrichum destructivum]